MGVCYIGIDKDNTLTKHGENNVYQPFLKKLDECKSVFGNRIVLVSNSDKLPSDIEKTLGIENVLYPPVKKPDGGEHLINFIREKENNSEFPINVAFIGDRILTDIIYSNKNNFLSILVTNPISTEGEPARITELRILEQRLMRLLIRLGKSHSIPSFIKARDHKELERIVRDCTNE